MSNKRPVMSLVSKKRFFFMLLALLIALVVVDGVITRVLIMDQLGVEANPFLKQWVKSDMLLIIKLAGATMASVILWRIFQRKPKLAWITTSVFIALYTLLILWNIAVFYIS
jgi:hypothetical protein